MTTISLEQLISLKVTGYSIIELEDRKIKALIFHTPDEIECGKIMEVFRSDKFGMKIGMNKEGNYSIHFEFVNSDYAFVFDTGENDYPPLQWLKNGDVEVLTAGVNNASHLIYRSDYVGLMS